MKFDDFGLLVREKPRDPGHEIANLGDSCADSCRWAILSQFIGEPFRINLWLFQDDNVGYLRHPTLANKEGWNNRDVTNDQYVPLMMAACLLDWHIFARMKKDVGFFIPGTRKITHPAIFAIKYKQWWALALMNKIQGWLLTWSFRWSDDEHEGAGFKSSKGKVQDYPTMIATTVFLNKIGYKARLPRPAKECIEALEAYRFNPKDFEPNAEWEIDIYRKAINDLSPYVGSLI